MSGHAERLERIRNDMREVLRPGSDDALKAGAAVLREVAELRADCTDLTLERDGIKHSRICPNNVPTGCKEEAPCLRCQRDELRARMEDARKLAEWTGAQTWVPREVLQIIGRILAATAAPTLPYDPACRWGCGGTGLTRDVYGKQICPCAQPKPLEPAPAAPAPATCVVCRRVPCACSGGAR